MHGSSAATISAKSLVQGAVADAAHHRVGELQLQLRSRRRAQALGQADGGRGLLLPPGFQADRRSWARLRKRCSEATTPAEPGLADGLLRVRDRPRQDLADLRSHRLRHQVLPRRHARRGVMDVVDADDYVIGEAPAPIAVVTDNGPCVCGVTFADVFAGDDPLFRHVRTR
jgi:hypothetical protein